MFGSICRLISSRFSALANLVLSRYTSRLFLCLGLSALVLSCLIPPASVLAAQVTSVWEDTCDPTLASYIVYYGCASGHYERTVDVGMQTTSTLLDLGEAQTYYFAVASQHAISEEGERSSKTIFDGPREGSEEETEKDEGAKAGEADGLRKGGGFSRADGALRSVCGQGRGR
jgi:hypothetical protein